MMNRALLAAGAVAAALLMLALGVVVVSGVAGSLPDVSSLARRVPERTALMRQRIAEARATGRPARIDHRWVPYETISPLLRRAVLIAEDDAFFSHDGLDWDEIRASVRRNMAAGRVVRGGSTITQQLARNLYLGNRRTLTRKLKEILFTRRLERALAKRRIFELYLNLIEWGDGVYGIEAAARTHFGVSAARLDARQAALLAAVIINPRRYDPVHPGRRIERRARMILARMWRRGLLSEPEYLIAIGRAPQPPALMRWLFGAPADSSAPGPTSPPADPDTAGAASDTLRS
jgi:monofunctional biosynthetic peptidoglycan transglycosylase